MRFGLFSNGERHNHIAADSYDEDLWEIRVADRLGFEEVWVSEHVADTSGDRPDAVSVADALIIKAAALTKQIKLAPGVRPIAFYHPVQVAMEAAMCDQLTRGRYMFGFGVGGKGQAMAQRGMTDHSDAVRRARMHEAIDLMVRCWTATEPFDYEGTFWQGEKIFPYPKPYQQPYMPVGVANARSMGTAELAGRHGFYPLCSQFDEPNHINDLAQVYLQAGHEVEAKRSRREIRAARFVWVTDSVTKAKTELRSTLGPLVEWEKRAFPDRFKGCIPPGGTLDEVDVERLIDIGFYFVGDPDRVCGLIRRHYDESGGFGVLLCVTGRPHGSRPARARSMRRFMAEVAPRLRDLSPDA
jgi:alkanesulfonate monooxygenase SsuD/methylene tetrahydromethanopterin reductase-like flavin-dependent oxidoreductase (luciferase family)